MCTLGAPNLCDNVRATGVNLPGSCAEFVIAPAAVTVRLADSLDAATGALIEPLSCVLNATQRGQALALGAKSAVADAGELGMADAVDLVLDASGHLGAIAAAFPLLRKRGRFVQMGVAHPDALLEVSPYGLYAKELAYIGANSVGESFVPAAELMVDLADALRPLITHTFPLDAYAGATAAMRSPDALKVQIA